MLSPGSAGPTGPSLRKATIVTNVDELFVFRRAAPAPRPA